MDWLQFTLKDFIDVLLVTISLYYIYKVLRTTGSRTLFTGILAFIFLWALIYRVMDMRLMGAILNQFMGVGFILLVILFQEDIKRFLNALGSSQRWRFISNLFGKSTQDGSKDSSYIAALTLATVNMAKKKTGALIVIENNIDLEPYEHTGEFIHADVNARLIENIFFKNSPLHDGALIVSKHRLTAAGCILPVAQNVNLPKEMGLRHRAGLGMSLMTDAKVIIVSEERGKIAVAYQGEVVADVEADALQQFLTPDFTDMAVLREMVAGA